MIKYYVCIKNGNISKKSGSRPEHLGLRNYDEVIEVTKDLVDTKYPLEKKNGKIVIDKVKKKEMDADKAETKRIRDKVKNKEDISNTELAWLQIGGGQ